MTSLNATPDAPQETQAFGTPSTGGATGERRDLSAFIQRDQDGHQVLYLMVDNIHCGGCVNRIERSLAEEQDVLSARVNLSTKRLTLRWTGAKEYGQHLLDRLSALGYEAAPFDPAALETKESTAERRLLIAMGVAGFGMANTMLIMVALWAGHVQGMEESTRQFLQWASGMIALPCIFIAVQPFAHSAWAALKAGRTNMDVPITIGVLLVTVMSLHELFRGGEHVYFESAVMLLFFLLVGRFLDLRSRGRARAVAGRLLGSLGRVASLVTNEGVKTVPVEDIRKGDTVQVAVGERIAVDGVIASGRSDVDTSLINGESLPASLGEGDQVFAGTLNLSAPLSLTVTAVGERTLLSEIVRLMETAEQSKSRLVHLADRVARMYTPVVHLLALAAFILWNVIIGLAWQDSLMIAVAVLIITCPCALGLAVPAVQVIAASRLMRGGVLLKSGTALERLAEIDTIVFDKTGTLTQGSLSLTPGTWSQEDLSLAAALGASSMHPLCVALRAAHPSATPRDGVEEHPGQGLSWAGPEGTVRLGSRRFLGIPDNADQPEAELWLQQPGAEPVRFAFRDQIRSDASLVLDHLRRSGFDLRLLSGDRPAAVGPLARQLGITDVRAGVQPQDKVAAVQELIQAGRKVLMVGDGLNDAPALAAATASMSPSTAADISQTAADVVFQGNNLAPVLNTLLVADQTRILVRQNFALATLYNVVMIPVAFAGLVTPWIAALAMSGSSLLVTGNAFRLNLAARRLEHSLVEEGRRTRKLVETTPAEALAWRF